MRPLQRLDKVWGCIEREFEECLGRNVSDEERVAVVLVVSALTKMLNEDTINE